MKALHTTLDARGRLGFAAAETMCEQLHAAPGAATALALFDDAEHHIEVVIDEHLRDATQLAFHSITQAESIRLTWPQLTAFLISTGHTPVFADLDDVRPEPEDSQ